MRNLLSIERIRSDKRNCDELVEKIVVNGDRGVDIVFKYSSPYPVEKQAVERLQFFLQ